MPTVREIKRRIRSIKNTQQITRAMQMVSASKMQRAQVRVLEARPYAEKIREVIRRLTERHPEYRHPFLIPREVRQMALVLVTTDKGLCGALNANLLRQVLRFMEGAGVPVRLITIGRKGRDFMRRIGVQIISEQTGLGDRPRLLDIVPSVKVAMEEYQEGRADRVYVAYSEFINTMVQRPRIQQIIPCPLDGEERSTQIWDYLYEPKSEAVLNALLPRYVESLVYHAILENIASEHSARMVAMKNATDNAKEILEELTLSYNKARQAAITKEMAEIAAGSAAVSK